MAKFSLRSWLRDASKPATKRDVKPKEAQKSVASTGTATPQPNKARQANGTATGGNGAVPQKEAAKPLAAPATEMSLLAEKIAQETKKLERYMADNNLPMPSFDVDSPAGFPKLPEDIKKSRQEIIYATKRLRDLAIGPEERVRWGVWGELTTGAFVSTPAGWNADCENAGRKALDVLALQLIYHFKLANLVPLTGTITLAELQTKTTLDAINLARVLRLAMTNHVFREPSPGVIAHTASSRALAEDDALSAWVGFNTEDIFRGSARVLEALEAYPEAVSPLRTGFNVMSGTVDKEPVFATFGKEPERARRMGRAMVSLTGGEGYEVWRLLDVAKGGYDFSALDAAGGTVVDVGGSHGFVCVEMGRMYKNLKFVVQDLPKTVESAPKPIDEDAQVAERITFQAHDFFTEQVAKDADVYYFRWIIHNYSTPFAVKILRALVPALKPGARVIINDHCLREPGQENPWDEEVIRRMDMVMLILLNAQERTEGEYRALFAEAHEDFVFKGVTRPQDCRMSIIEAVWQPGHRTQPAVEATTVETTTAEATTAEAAAAQEQPAVTEVAEA